MRTERVLLIGENLNKATPERGGSRRSRRLPTAEWTEQQEEVGCL
jgi:hypothetical protein